MISLHWFFTNKTKPLKIKLNVDDKQPATVDVSDLFDMNMFKN